MTTALSGLHNSFSTFFRDILNGTKTIGQAFANLGMSILDSMASAFAGIIADWIMTHVVIAALNAIFGEGLIGTAAKTKESNAMLAASAAALAGANTLALTSLLYPPPTPEILAGVAYTIGMGFAALASAAGGMEVDRDQMLFAHKNEKVLPARISQGFDRIINSFSFPAAQFSAPRLPALTPAMAGGAIGGGGGGVVNHNVHVTWSVTAIDSQGVEEFFRSNANKLTRQIERSLRNGWTPKK